MYKKKIISLFTILAILTSSLAPIIANAESEISEADLTNEDEEITLSEHDRFTGDTIIHEDGSFEQASTMIMPRSSTVVEPFPTATFARGFLNFRQYSTTSTISVYATSTTTSSYTYFNGGSANYVPVLGEANNRYQININGYTGWINKSSIMGYESFSSIVTKGVDSYYKRNSSGALTYSYYYYDRRVTINVGLAPNFLETNKKYYSFDGIYFYNYIQSMFDDASNGTTSRAVNKTPFYNYYQYLPFRSSTNITANEMLSYINSKGYNTSNSVLANSNAINTFIEGEAKFSVNAAMEFSMAILESGYGTSNIAVNKNNLFGWGAVDSGPYAGAYHFPTIKEGILYHFENGLSDGYLDSGFDYRYFGGSFGNKNTGVNVRYASDPYWGMKNAGIYYKLDESTGFKDYNYYTIGIKTDYSKPALYHKNKVVTPDLYHYRKNIKIKNIPFLIINKSGNTYTTISDVAFLNDGDDNKKPVIDSSTNSIYRRTSVSCTTVIDSMCGVADHSFDQDIVSFSSDSILLVGGKNYNVPTGSYLPYETYTFHGKNQSIIFIEDSQGNSYGYYRNNVTEKTFEQLHLKALSQVKAGNASNLQKALNYQLINLRKYVPLTVKEVNNNSFNLVDSSNRVRANFYYPPANRYYSGKKSNPSIVSLYNNNKVVTFKQQLTTKNVLFKETTYTENGTLWYIDTFTTSGSQLYRHLYSTSSKKLLSISRYTTAGKLFSTKTYTTKGILYYERIYSTKSGYLLYKIVYTEAGKQLTKDYYYSSGKLYLREYYSTQTGKLLYRKYY